MQKRVTPFKSRIESQHPRSQLFAGWGTISNLKLSEDSMEEEKGFKKDKKLGKWTAISIAGCAVAGSPFYAFPSIVAVAGVYSPLPLFISTLILGLYRPILELLAELFPQSGANYLYL